MIRRLNKENFLPKFSGGSLPLWQWSSARADAVEARLFRRYVSSFYLRVSSHGNNNDKDKKEIKNEKIKETIRFSNWCSDKSMVQTILPLFLTDFCAFSNIRKILQIQQLIELIDIMRQINKSFDCGLKLTTTFTYSSLHGFLKCKSNIQLLCFLVPLF